MQIAFLVDDDLLDGAPLDGLIILLLMEPWRFGDRSIEDLFDQTARRFSRSCCQIRGLLFACSNSPRLAASHFRFTFNSVSLSIPRFQLKEDRAMAAERPLKLPVVGTP